MLYLTVFMASVLRKTQPRMFSACFEQFPALHGHGVECKWDSPQCEQRNLLFSLFALFQTKVGGTSHTGGSFEEVLSSTAHASAQSSLAGTRLPESEEELQC